MREEYTISTDKTRLDVNRIHRFLTSNSYWAQNRSLETVRTSIENSLCFGVFQGAELVGFARVITDCAIFAWLLDVYVEEAHRHQGVGKFLLKTVLAQPDLQNVKRWMLGTRDAHGLYEQYGFGALQQPGSFMERLNPNHR